MREHLTGEQVVGLYALNTKSHCRFVVADFDHESWQDDTRALVRTCRRLDIPVLPEISRSGDGAHVWFFFDSPVAAAAAFANPHWHELEKVHRSTWKIAR